MASYFGTNGIRGKADLLTTQFVSAMCRAFAKYQTEKSKKRTSKVLVARDTRVSGEQLEKSAVAGLLSYGSEAVLLGVSPSPVVEFNTKKSNVMGAVIITASHNPPDWNGLKFLDEDGIAVSMELGEDIEKLFESEIPGKELSARGSITRQNPFQDYVKEIKKTINVKKLQAKKLRVVLDCANGTCSLVVPGLLKELGCEVSTLNANPDGTFPGRESEPARENVGDLIECVKALNADLGIAFDGDGDRVIFIDENGGYIIGDRSFALSVKLKLEKKKGPVVTTVATTNAIRDICSEYNCRLELTKVGGPYISETVRELNAVIGGEEVGGVVWPEVHYGKDGIITALKIIESVCDRKLSDSVSSLPVYFNAKIKIPCTREEKTRVISVIKNELRNEKLVTLDGVRVNKQDAWSIIRASGTENYIRIFTEAKEEKRAEALLKEHDKLVRKIISECKG